MGGWWPSVWCRLGLWHHLGRIPSPSWGNPSGRNGLPPFPPWLHLNLSGVAAVTQTWQLQNESVSMSCKLPLHYCAHGPIYNFGSNHDWDHLRIGHGLYDQQQHILIVIFNPPGSRDWPLQTWGMQWQNPLYPLVPITDPGAGSAVQNSHKIWRLCWRPEHQNQSIQSFPAHPLSLGLLGCPTKWAMGSGLRKGTGATSGHPVLWATFIVVSFSLGSGRICWWPTVGCCSWCQWGVRLHSLSSPQTGLKFWLGWHIPKPYGPNPGT